MAFTIHYNPEGLTTASQQLRDQHENFVQLIKSMETTVGSLPESWEGAAASAYIEQFESLKPGLNETAELIQTIQQQIDQILKNVQELDSNMAGQLGR